MKYPEISPDPAIQAEYVQMRKSGTSHSLAEMFALQQSPGLQTDTRFMSENHSYNQFDGGAGDKMAGDRAMDEARRAGVITSGGRYCHQLASYPGDPTAWVWSRADVVEAARRKGLQVEGCGIKYRPPEEPIKIWDNDYKVADDIVQDELESRVLDGEKPTPELKQEISARLSGK